MTPTYDFQNFVTFTSQEMEDFIRQDDEDRESARLDYESELKQSAEREAYLEAHPGACRSCGGRGHLGAYYDSGTGMWDGNPCDALPEGICHQCGKDDCDCEVSK